MMTKKELLHEIEVIPPFASSLMKLTNLILSGDYSIDEVSQIVRLDQGLTLDVIGYANSAESGAAKEITSVHEAIVRLGGSRIMRYLLAKWFRGNVTSSIGSGKDGGDYWRHGVFAAVAVDVLADGFPAFHNPAAFTVGLIHDIGRLPFGMWAKRNRISWDWSVNELKAREKEMSIFGWNHSEVGAMILERWKFPAALVECVRFHSEENGGPQPLTDGVRLANQICRALTADPSTGGQDLSASPVCVRNEISSAQFQELVLATGQIGVQMVEEFGASS